MLRWGLALLCMSLTACGISRVSSVSGGQRAAVKTIAMMPGGGLLADAVAVELANRGFTVIDSASTSNLMVRLNVHEVEVAQPEGLAKLREKGIDAVLAVRAAAGYDNEPQSASARMSATESGALLAGVTWQNGFGGAEGSIADRVMRRGLSQAAAEIADELAAKVARRG